MNTFGQFALAIRLVLGNHLLPQSSLSLLATYVHYNGTVCVLDMSPIEVLPVTVVRKHVPIGDSGLVIKHGYHGNISLHCCSVLCIVWSYSTTMPQRICGGWYYRKWLLDLLTSPLHHFHFPTSPPSPSSPFTHFLPLVSHSSPSPFPPPSLSLPSPSPLLFRPLPPLPSPLPPLPPLPFPSPPLPPR